MRLSRPGTFARRGVLVGASLSALVFAAPQASAQSGDAAQAGLARYRVKLLGLSPLRLQVSADLPAGATLDMVQDYPAERPEMAAGGWPALISGLQVLDASGRSLQPESKGDSGWRLPQAEGRLTLVYVVDYSPFQGPDWSSPLESAVTDSDHVALVGRSLFITTPAVGSAQVDFDLPEPWRPVAPWAPLPGGSGFGVGGVPDLIDNVIVFSTEPPDRVTAGGFTLQITSMGHWKPLRPLLRRTLQTVIEREVALMGFDQREVYNVVLLPTADTGGNAYRQSFVYCYNEPTADNHAVWANTLAHEIFHYWNYARLRGADYASTQWFQEGFTEYAANLVTVTGGLINENAFLAKLGVHVSNAARLATTLEDIGTHKGPPLYSAGALTAFCFDIMIRNASGNRSNIGDFFRNLWRQTDSGRRRYAWEDIRAALQTTATADWQGFYLASIRGHDPLPLDAVLPMAGLRVDRSDDTPSVEIDPEASPQARTLWRSLVHGR